MVLWGILLGKLIDGDDGLEANDEVGDWALEKHQCLTRYIDISRSVRKGFIGPTKAGATYIDPFCATGRARTKSKRWIEGGAVVAWKASQASKHPFSAMYIGDIDPVARKACAERLRRLGAPVIEVDGGAVEMIAAVVPLLNPYGLHFAFIDPYSLEALDFRIMRSLAPLRRIDILVHISQMDLQRNLGSNLSDESAFDIFAPGWRHVVDVNQAQLPLRQAVFGYWRDQVAALGTDAESDARLIKGGSNQALYWLLIVAKHQLAAQFGTVALNIEGQRSLFD